MDYYTDKQNITENNKLISNVKDDWFSGSCISADFILIRTPV